MTGRCEGTEIDFIVDTSLGMHESRSCMIKNIQRLSACFNQRIARPSAPAILGAPGGRSTRSLKTGE